MARENKSNRPRRVDNIERRMKGLDFTQSIDPDSLPEYATKDEIPVNLSDLNDDKNYATEQWVNNKGYLTEHQDISGKADKSNAVTHPENTAVGSVHRPIYVDSNGQSTQCSYDLTIVKGLNKENSKLYLVGSNTQNYFADSNTNVNNYIDADNILNTLTASNDDNSTKVATTEFVQNIINSNIGVNTDLSNLSSTGKKVLDGQWVSHFKLLSGATAINTYTIDLSEELPNDNYQYEILFGMFFASSSSTTTIVTLKTDIIGGFTNDNLDGLSVNNNSMRAGSYVSMPVGTGRYCTYQISGHTLAQRTNKGLFMFGYRRIGTNQ